MDDKRRAGWWTYPLGLRLHVLATCLLFGTLGCASESERTPLAITETADGYLVTEGSDSVLVYRPRPIRPGHKHARSHYIHPLYGLEGAVLTEDYPADHPHHHGIFWAWHQVYVGAKRMGDSWVQEDFLWDVYRVDVLDEQHRTVALRSYVYWKSPRWTGADGRLEPFVREVTTIRVHPATGDLRKIDVQIKLRALEDSVRIGGSEDEKGYGGFSARLRLPEDVRFIGPRGAVEPRPLDVEAGPWMDFSASFHQGQPSGLAILEHPSLPGYPHPWILRRQSSMQNAKYPGAEPVLLPRDDELTLRYRLIVHWGRARQVSLDSLYDRYAAQSYVD